MASSVDFILNLNGDQARKVLLDLHRKGNSLFSQQGYDLKLNSRGFTRSLDQATDRVLSFTAATTIFSTVGLAMRRLASDAITVETSIAQIQSILNATSSDLSGFTDSLFKLANKTGVGFADAAKAAEEFSRQGLTLEKTLKATEAALSLARVSGGNLEKTVANLVSITSAFANEALIYEEVADTLGALDAAFSTTTTGLAEGLSRVSAVANGVGVSFKEMASLIAATKQVTGRSEAVIGNAFKSIFTNIGTDAVQNELRAIGVETRNLDGTFIDAERVIASLAETYDKLTDAQRANISFKVAGKYNKNILEGAIFAQNQGVSDKAFKVADSAAGSIAERLKVLNDTTATSLQTLQNSITQLSTGSVGGLFKELTKEVSVFAKSFVDGVVGAFAEGNPVGNAIAGGIAGILKGPVLIVGLALVGKLVQKVVLDLVRAGRSLFGVNSGFQSQRSILIQINDEIVRGNALLAQRAALVSSAAPKGNASAVNPAYFPNTIAGGGRFAPNTKPIFKPNPNDSKYLTVRSGFSSVLDPAYLADRAKYNKQMAARAAQNAAGKKLFDKGKLARIEAYQNTSLRGGFFGIEKREKAFARSQGVSENQQAVKDRIAMSRQNRSDKIKGGAFGATLLAPMIGSFAQQAIGGGGGKIAGSIGEAASIAALGVMIGGPFVIAVTSAIAAMKVFSTVTEVAFGDLEKLNKGLKDNVGELEKNIQAGSAYIAAQRDYNEALKSGDAALIVKTARELSSAGQNLKGDRRKLISITDPEQQQKLLNDLDKSSEGLANASLAAITANNLVAKAYEGTFDKLKSLAGFQKTFSQTDISEAAGAIGKGIDPNAIKDLTGIQSRFAQTGNSQEIQNIIGDLVGKVPDLSNAFKAIAVKGKDATEQLALATLAYIANQKITNDLTEGQKRTAETLSELNKTFKVSISRVSINREELMRDRSSNAQTQIGVNRILQGDGEGVEGIRRERNFNIQELEAKTRADIAQLQQTLIEGVEKAVEDSKDVPSKIKGKDFILKIAEEGYNFANFLQDFTSSVGDAENGFIKVKDKHDIFAKALAENIKASERELEASKKLTAAKEAVEKRRLSAEAFGPLTGDQTESRDIANAGRKAENKILSFYKNPIAKKDVLDVISDQDAEDVLLKAEQEKASGKKISGNRTILLTAARKRIESSFGTEAKTSIQSRIEEAISANSAFNKSRGLIDPDQKNNRQITQQIEEQVLKGDFGKAEKLAGQLNVGDNSGIIAAIKEQADKSSNKIQSAEDYVAQLMGDAVNVPLDNNTASNDRNTDASNALTKKFEEFLSVSRPPQPSGVMSDSIDGEKAREERAKNTSLITQELQTNVEAPLAIKEQQLTEVVKAQAGMKDFLEQSKQIFTDFGFSQLFFQGGSQPEPSILQAQKNNIITPNGLGEAYSKSIGAYEDLPGLAGFKTTEEERLKIPPIYNNPDFKTSEQRRGGFIDAFGEQRGGELFGAVEEFTNKEKKLEGVSVGDTKSLEKEIQSLRVKKEEMQKQVDAIKEQSKAAQESTKAAQSMEVSAKSMESAAALISRGVEQNFKGLLDVAFSGADFLQNSNVVAELESTIKRLFIQYREEETGKKPALSPTSPRTAVA